MAARTAKRGTKEEQAAKRLVALRLVRGGKMTQAQIADVLGVARGTVAGWSGASKKKGTAALALKKRGKKQGQGKLLSAAQARKIIAIIRDKTPRQLKMEFHLWSVGAVMTLIEEKLGKSLSESSVRNYLKAWGFTIQRPATRYSRRDDVVIQRWLVEEYPKIAASAKACGAEIHWLDETGVNNQAIYQRSFAPKGKTPRATKPANREKISLISTVTNQGTMRFRLYEGGLKKEKLIAFLEGLLAETNRKLFVIMDNLKVHKSLEVQAWAEKNKERIQLFYLPPYAPEHNPDEYLNNDLKQNVHKKSGLPLDKKTLKAKVLQYMRHIQKSPAKVRGYFQAPETQYAA
jgi:transposase